MVLWMWARLAGIGAAGGREQGAGLGLLPGADADCQRGGAAVEPYHAGAQHLGWRRSRGADRWGRLQRCRRVAGQSGAAGHRRGRAGERCVPAGGRSAAGRSAGNRCAWPPAVFNGQVVVLGSQRRRNDENEQGQPEAAEEIDNRIGVGLRASRLLLGLAKNKVINRVTFILSTALCIEKSFQKSTEF